MCTGAMKDTDPTCMCSDVFLQLISHEEGDGMSALGVVEI